MSLQQTSRLLALGLLVSVSTACDIDIDFDSDSEGEDGPNDDGATSQDDGDGDSDGGSSGSGGDSLGATSGQESDGGSGDDMPGDDMPGDDAPPPPGGNGCDLGPAPAPDPTLMDKLMPNPAASSIIDCDLGAGYDTSSWRAVSSSEPRLWVGGVYETRSDHSFGNHPKGDGFVTWSIPGNNVLVLSAYEPTHWTVELSGAGELSKVVAIGYHVQTVDAPGVGVVETYSYEAGDCQYTCGYSLPGQGGGCEGEELVAVAQHVTSLPLHAFDGCYHATTFDYAP